MWDDCFSLSPDCFNIRSHAVTSFNYLSSHCLAQPFVLCWMQHLLLLFWLFESDSNVTQLQSAALRRMTDSTAHSPILLFTAPCRPSQRDSKSLLVTSPRSYYLLAPFSGKKSRFHLRPLEFSWQVWHTSGLGKVWLCACRQFGLLQSLRCRKTSWKARTDCTHPGNWYNNFEW